MGPVAAPERSAGHGTAAAIVAAQDVHFSYHARPALAGVSLAASPGTILAVVGPNGSGKSTLLQLLGGLRAPKGGRVLIYGSDRPPKPELRRRMGYLADDAACFEELTGFENIALFLRIRAAEHDQLAVAIALGLDSDVLRQTVATYSFGTRRKLALAQTLVGPPDLILLDEPTIGLDASARERLANVLRDRAAQRATTVMASNDLHFVQAIAEHVVFLHAGRVALSGSPAELLDPLRIESSFEIETTGDYRLSALEGCRLTIRGERCVSIRAEAGARELPRVVDALLRAGNEIRSIEVRQADLSDVFRRVTGIDWTGSWPPE